ncbi:HEAT repeat domain-containing protein [Kitasatospora sp. DSM 101779]|uniref:HEAT repeat domain-containing protein n=1 Tax=Kitasatospora sp. DSM 101779 TaxID=2853165 RepID=UPI0021D87E11|nr:HEAT repeat domain-containing protein [Kitasatospora sp. DSM 101779]MCU7820099.1 HEAT repeat domain-containing protein [Kitasatospora sp. DSM 101779]
MALTLDEAVEQLGHRFSPKRRSAATRLRRLADPVAGPALTEALEREVRDSRAWETQYQMVMALGMCGHRPVLGLLRNLAQRPFEATMVYTALGDAIVRLSAPEGTPESLRWCLDSGTQMLADGALRAVAMQRLCLDTATIDHVLDFLEPLDPHDGLRFWAAAAAAGRPGSQVTRFLHECAAGPRSDVATAAASSLQGKYRTYTPL